MNSHYSQQNIFLDKILEEAEQGDDKYYFYNLLQKIENRSREWMFHQVHNKLTLEQHQSLIRRKHDIIQHIRYELKDMELDKE